MTGPRGPDERLRAAAALVYVSDLAELDLGAGDEHHLVQVLRLRAGETVAVSDGRGGLRRCTLVLEAASGRTRRARLEPLGDPERVPPPPERLTVGFAMVKGERTEWTVQKLTELGIDRIVPLISERSVVRLDDADAARRKERLARIVREAGAQSRRLHLPALEEPQALAAFLAVEPGAERALAEPGAPPFAPSARTVLVGPEGGWSSRELEACPVHVGLGPTVLRTETAALVAATLLAHHVGRIGS